MNTQLVAPVLQDLSLAIHGDNDVVSLVALLFVICRPAAVFWRVSGVVVFALNSQAGFKSRPHVFCKKAYILPSVANFYAACAVKLKLRVARIVATADHVPPNPVKRAIAKPVFNKEFSVFAPATRCSATLNAVQRANRLFAAVAPIQRLISIFAFWFANGKDYNSAKPIPWFNGFAFVRNKPIIFNIHSFKLLQVTA